MKRPPTGPLVECLALGAASMAWACAGANERDFGRDAAAANTSTSDGGGGLPNLCIPCVTASDCPAGATCAQFGGDTYCVPPCAAGRACSPDRACAAEVSVTGTRVDVCVPRGDACGGSFGAHPDGGRAGSLYAGGAVTGRVGATGGRVSRLYFVVVGDTRPANIDDTGGYPVAIIRKIFQDAQSLDPAPLFGVSTGDYMFASTRGGQAAPQLDRYLYARAAFSGIMFPAMGNHECTGATTSNCGSTNADGTPDNYLQFLAKMLQPIGQSAPYYNFGVDSTNGMWTAKFVFVAANAWDDAQAIWLDATLARATTYTFIVRHEPKSASTAPGVSPAEEIQSRHPYTLSIVGHSHTYARSGVKEVVFGNGGAPLTSSRANYGFGLVQLRADGAIQIDAIDYATMQRDTAFAFAVMPDGSPAP